MAIGLDPKQIVSFEELLMSQVVQQFQSVPNSFLVNRMLEPDLLLNFRGIGQMPLVTLFHQPIHQPNTNYMSTQPQSRLFPQEKEEATFGSIPYCSQVTSYIPASHHHHQ